MKKAINIKWELEEGMKLEDLPSEILIPEEIENDEESISCYITAETGFCHKGFELTMGPKVSTRRRNKMKWIKTENKLPKLFEEVRVVLEYTTTGSRITTTAIRYRDLSNKNEIYHWHLISGNRIEIGDPEVKVLAWHELDEFEGFDED